MKQENGRSFVEVNNCQIVLVIAAVLILVGLGLALPAVGFGISSRVQVEAVGRMADAVAAQKSPPPTRTTKRRPTTKDTTQLR